MKTAVVGAGHMGRIHAEKYRVLDVEWLGIYDRVPEVAQKLAREVGGVVLSTLEQVAAEAEAVSVCVPVRDHLSVAGPLLEAGCHLLLEKPITHTEDEARRLIELARRSGRVLQVAHQERFNPAIRAATEHVHLPRFLEIHRLGMPDPREGQIDVIRDVMIHDLDLLLSWIDEPVVQIDAVGAPVLSDELDIANARLRFAGGCVANLTVSRVTPKKTRKIRVFYAEGYLSIDCEAQTVSRVYRQGGAIQGQFLEIEPRDCVQQQLAGFLDAVRSGTEPLVGGEDGLRALALAIQIQRKIQHHIEAYGGF